MKFNILESVMCLYFLCQVASGSSSSSSSSSHGKSGIGQGQKLQDIKDRLDAAEGKLEKICEWLAKLTDKPGDCPKVELMLPETCDDEQVSSCSFDLECKGENEKCCADACGIKQCKQIARCQLNLKEDFYCTFVTNGKSTYEMDTCASDVACCKVEDRIVPPGEKFFDGCNNCTCSDNGLLLCTKKGCICPGGVQQVQCFARPCNVTPLKCEKYPELDCQDNYCGGCNAEIRGPAGNLLTEDDCDCGANGPIEQCPKGICENRPNCPVFACIPDMECPVLKCIVNQCTCTGDWIWTNGNGQPVTEEECPPHSPR